MRHFKDLTQTKEHCGPINSVGGFTDEYKVCRQECPLSGGVKLGQAERSSRGTMCKNTQLSLAVRSAQRGRRYYI